MIAQCECDANQIYQDLVSRGAMMHKQKCDAEPHGVEPHGGDTHGDEPQKAEAQSNTCQNGGCDCNNNAPTTNENTIDDIVKAVVSENTNTANAEVDGANKVEGGKKKRATKKHTSKKAEDYLSSSEDTSDGTSEGTSEDTSEGTSSESISDADTSDLSEISADDNIAQADETTGTTVMYF